MFIDHRVFEHALDIVARLENRDQLDPADPFDPAIARVAIAAQPAVHIARPGVIGRHRQRVGAVVIGKHPREIAVAEADVVGPAAAPREAVARRAEPDPPGLFARGAGHELHQPLGAGVADTFIVELAFLPGDSMDHRPVDPGRRFDRRETDAGEAGIAFFRRGPPDHHRQFGQVLLARQFGGQHQFAFAAGGISKLGVEIARGAPVALTANHADRLRHRAGGKGGTLFGGRHRGRLRAVSRRAAKPFEREQTVIIFGEASGHFEISRRARLIARLLRGAAGPVKPLGLGLRGARRRTIAIEQRRSRRPVAQLPQRLRPAEPFQGGVIIAQLEAERGDVGARREQIVARAGDPHRIARIAGAGGDQHFADEILGISGQAGKGRAAGQQARRALALRGAPIVAGEIIDISRIALRFGRDGHADAGRLGTLQQRQAGHRRRAVGRADIGDLARGRLGIALPQQRTHPLVLILGREPAAQRLQQIHFGSAAHLAAAPRRARGLERFGPAQRLQGQRVARPAWIGQRRILREIGDQLFGRGAAALERILCPGAQQFLAREAGEGEKEAGIIGKAHLRIAGQHGPTAGRLRGVGRGHRHQLAARLIDLRRGLRRSGGGNRQRRAGEKRGEQKTGAVHAGHDAGRLLIRC